MTTRAIWDAVSGLLDYPAGPALRSIDECLRILRPEVGPLAGAAETFHRYLETTDEAEREERFTRTFDINPACTLEIGWQLYGEDYRRGAFLVSARQWMRELGVEETGELPDHLTHLLRVLGRLDDPDQAAFSTTFLQPALAKMTERFKDGDNPYRILLVALNEALEARYGEATPDPGPSVAAGSVSATASIGCAPCAGVPYRPQDPSERSS